MSDPFLGEIRILPFSFVPAGWAACNGQIMPISQNQALYSIIGIAYGGDARQTFGIPNLQGRTAMGTGSGPGLTPRGIANHGGYETVQLVESQIPSHTHETVFERDPIETESPDDALFGSTSGMRYWTDNLTGLAPASPQFLAKAGNSDDHENRQPFLYMRFCICIDGDYPSRN